MQAKNLGQNFLADPAILKKDCGGFSKNNDLVLEIVVRTERAWNFNHWCNVIAVEKDHRLIATLTEKFTWKIKTGQLKIIEADILNLLLKL